MTKSRVEPRRPPATIVKATFRIPRNAVKAIEDGFGFKLTAQEMVHLKIAARKTIDLRRRALGRGAREEYRRELAVTRRRRQKIVEAVDQLLCLLDADKCDEPFWCLSLSNATEFTPRGTILRLEDVAPILGFLKRLAQSPHAVEAVALWEGRSRQSREQRKRKNIDYAGWKVLILAGMKIFLNKRLPPTANYTQKTKRYNSPLLRGLFKLHDALPTDVQATSAFALGSPAFELIKNFNKSMKAELGRK